MIQATMPGGTQTTPRRGRRPAHVETDRMTLHTIAFDRIEEFVRRDRTCRHSPEDDHQRQVLHATSYEGIVSGVPIAASIGLPSNLFEPSRTSNSTNVQLTDDDGARSVPSAPALCCQVA